VPKSGLPGWERWRKREKVNARSKNQKVKKSDNIHPEKEGRPGKGAGWGRCAEQGSGQERGKSASTRTKKKNGNGTKKGNKTGRDKKGPAVGSLLGGWGEGEQTERKVENKKPGKKKKSGSGLTVKKGGKEPEEREKCRDKG